MKRWTVLIVSVALIFSLWGCNGYTDANDTDRGTSDIDISSVQADTRNDQVNPIPQKMESVQSEPFTKDTKLSEFIDNPLFEDYGRLFVPANGYYSGETLGNFELSFYGIDPDKTVEIANYMKSQVESGETVFYDIYTDREKEDDPQKADTGLFLFRGKPGGKFAICNAGGAFTFVGAMQDSFPHALELSKQGYNAFALIYRPGRNNSLEDLARAIDFIFEHADELQVDTECYSLWGGSAGAQMVAALGSYGTASYGGGDHPGPGAIVMQYTAYSDYTENDPPTYACIGTNDDMSNWHAAQSRIEALDELGIPTEFHAYEGLEHGFGLGTGTIAEGWIDDAMAFWEAQMDE